MKLFILIACLCTLALAEYKSYDGYKVFGITPKSQTDIEVLANFFDEDGIDFWDSLKITGSSARVMVSPEKINFFTSELSAYGIEYTLMIQNVEE